MSISSKKTAKGGNPSTPSSSTSKQSVAAAAVEDSGGKSRSGQIRDSPEQSKLAAALRGEVTKTGTPKSATSTTPAAKANYKQINYTRPLYEGWVRELVWRKEESKDGDVFYYPPQAGNEPRQKIRNTGELEAYLITSGSQFPTSFFSFKKEAVGGPEGGEIIRDAEDSAKAPESKAQESNQAGTPSLVLGKRVSKPPEKLVAEQPAESSTLTPSRMSKRVSRPPGKYSDEEPPAKVARVEAGERRPSAGTKEQGATPVNVKEPVRDWTHAVKEETMLKAKASSPTVKQLPGLPGLKLKTFSKMSADSRNQVQEKAGAAAAGGESDVIMVEGEPETAPAPPMPPLAMSITKVKKPQMPNLPRGTLITLPGAPTTGPPPPTRSYPTPVPATRQPVGPQSNAVTPGGVSITSLGLGAAPMGGPRTVGPSPPNLSRSPLSAMPQHRNLKSVGKYLRPTKPTQLPCSIHCLGVTGIPSLSCTACHCLYHPKCVGLPPIVATSPHHQAFYCSDCVPPPDRTGPVSAPTPGVTPQAASKESAAVSALQRQQQQSSPANRVDPQQRPKAVREEKKAPAVPAPFPGQQMVNIAGKKFLVTPHPAPAPSLESPPPSPPQLPIRGGGSNNEQQNSRSMQQNLHRQATERLSVLLRPVDGGDSPSFEVEETPDGKFLLVPYQEGTSGQQRPKSWTGQNKAGKKGEEEEVVNKTATVKSWGSNFTNNLSGGYHAMMQVFRYLSVRERLQASSVCKLWRDIALHQSLWQTVSLKNTRVYSWAGFGEFLRQTKATQLDLRKMLFVKERDATWTEIVGIASNFTGLRKLELPKLEGSVLAALATACPRLESLQAPLVAPPLDLQKVVSIPGLKELKLKASAGSSLKVRADTSRSQSSQLFFFR